MRETDTTWPVISEEPPLADHGSRCELHKMMREMQASIGERLWLPIEGGEYASAWEW